MSDDGRVTRPSVGAATRARLVAIATAVVGLPRVARARLVLDRFNAVDGGLLAAGVAYNAVLALIPLGLLATGLAGFFLREPGSQAEVIKAVVTFAPPLAGVIDEILVGLSAASPSISLIGLILAAWGTSRLFAALESGVAQMFSGAPRRSLVGRTAWRLGSIAVVAAILLAALIGAPALAIVGDVVSVSGPLGQVLGGLTVLLPIVVIGLSIATVYRFIPPTRPSWQAIGLPAVAGSLALLALTRLFVFLAPRLFGANFVYGTLGAIFVGLAWLNLVFTVVLLGAAWVRERSLDEAPTVV